MDFNEETGPWPAGENNSLSRYYGVSLVLEGMLHAADCVDMNCSFPDCKNIIATMRRVCQAVSTRRGLTPYIWRLYNLYKHWRNCQVCRYCSYMKAEIILRNTPASTVIDLVGNESGPNAAIEDDSLSDAETLIL